MKYKTRVNWTRVIDTLITLTVAWIYLVVGVGFFTMLARFVIATPIGR